MAPVCPPKSIFFLELLPEFIVEISIIRAVAAYWLISFVFTNEDKNYNNHNTISDLFLNLVNLNISNAVKQWLKRKYLVIIWQ